MAANLSAVFELVDRMSDKMAAISNSGEDMLDRFERTETAADGAFQSIDDGGRRASKAADGVATSARSMGESAERASDSMKEASESVYDFGDSAEKNGEKASNAFQDIANTLAGAAIVKGLKEVAGAMMEASDAAAEFETAAAKVSTIADPTVKSLDTIKTEITSLSMETGKSVTELSEATYSALSAGVNTADAVEFAGTATKLAAGGFTSAETAVDVLTTTLNAYRLEATQADNISNMLITTQNLGKTTVDQLASSMGKVIPLASAYGVEMDNLSTAYAVMTANGIATAETTTYLKSMLNELGSSTSTVAGVLLEETGETFAQLTAEGKSLGDVLEIIGDSVGGDSTAFNELWSSAEAGIGALSLLNSGSEKYNSVLKQMEQSAGATEKAYEAMTSTTEQSSRRLQNSMNNLNIAIGDYLNPTITKFRNNLATAVDGITGFVQQHPVAVKAIGAFATVVGGVTAAIAAYSVAAKVAAAASALFSASIPGLNIVLGVTAAVGGLVAGVVALTEACKDDLPPLEELTSAAQNMEDVISDSKSSYEDTAEELMATANVADRYISKLEDMGDYASLSAEEQGEYQRILTLLTQTVPDLADKIDIENGYIEGGTAALRENTAAWRENAMAQAFQEELTEMYSAQADVLVEAEKNRLKLTEAETKAADAAAKASAVEARKNEIWADAKALADQLNEENGNYAASAQSVMWMLGDEADEYSRLIDEEAHYLTIRDQATAEADRYREALAEDEEAVSQAEAAIKETEDAINSLTGTMEESEPVIDNSAQIQAHVEEAITSVYEAAKELEEEYTEMYNAAYDSVSGQYAIWDEAAEKIPTSAENINKALEGQTSYWQDYNSNLQSLTERAGEIEGLSEMLSSFADGSEESVNAVAGMAAANDEDLAAMVANWKALQEEQAKVADSIAELKTDFSEKMDELQAELEADIEGMDMSAQAKQSAIATINGYIDGATDMLPQVQLAYRDIAETAEKALLGYAGGSGSSVHYASVTPVRGYATGTTDAPEAFIAGENGPELIVGASGSTVFPAEETQRIVDAVSDNDAGVFQMPEAIADGFQTPEALVRQISNDGSREVPQGGAEVLQSGVEAPQGGEVFQSGDDVSSRRVYLEIAGSGKIDITGGRVDKDAIVDVLYEYLKPVLADIIAEETFEEGDGSYEY